MTEIKYPVPNKKSLFLYRLRQLLRLIFILAIIVCPIVNYLTEGKAWSIVVLWSIFMIWQNFLAPDVIEFLSLGQIFRLGSSILILIALIGIFLSPGWLGIVLPIVGNGILIISLIFFFIKMERHKHEIMPLIVEIISALIAVTVQYCLVGTLKWPMIVLGCLSAITGILGLIVFHKEIWRELVKRLAL
ncbi:MAG: hypothetical protein HUK23_02885 [Sphaerochaetaceae bacterium]|nr:hypothetical protein [Sphaerochaetaceae bacterium]